MILTKSSGTILGPLSWLLGHILNAIYNVFYSINIHSIGFSIIVFTIIVRLMLFPTNLKTTRSSKIQEYIRPEMNKIQKKYRGKKDQESLINQQREIRELQSKYGIKMSAGCLTALVQLPIFFALYRVIQNIPAYVDKVKGLYTPIAKAIYSAPNGVEKLQAFVSDEKSLKAYVKTAGKIATRSDASTSDAGKSINRVIDILGKCTGDVFDKLKETFNAVPDVVNRIEENVNNIEKTNTFFGINLTEAPGYKLSWALIIPILSFVFQFLSMKVMPQQSTGDPQQDASMKSMRTMTYIMPFFSFFICLSVPAGVGLYWAASAAIGFLITVLTNAYYKRADMDAIVKKQMDKAAKKMEKRKAKGKKSWMERMQDAAQGQDRSAEARANQRGISKYGSYNLKSYSPDKNDDSSSNDKNSGKPQAKYRAGSLSAKANAVRDFNNKGERK